MTLFGYVLINKRRMDATIAWLHDEITELRRENRQLSKQLWTMIDARDTIPPSGAQPIKPDQLP